MRLLNGISYENYEIMCDALSGCGWAKTVYEAAGDLLDIELAEDVKIESKWDVINITYHGRKTALSANEYNEITIK